jgi:hypothetical protein
MLVPLRLLHPTRNSLHLLSQNGVHSRAAQGGAHAGTREVQGAAHHGQGN